MVERVKEILRQSFPGMNVEAIRTTSAGRVAGRVEWDGFADMDDVERQERIRAILRDKLGDEFHEVSILLAYTPDELRAMQSA